MPKFFERQYEVAVCRTDDKDRIACGKIYHVIKNNVGEFSADPFPFEYEGELYIFAELFQYSRDKGVIGFCKMKNDGCFTKWKPVIDEPHHLSFPNIFEFDGNIYICPEANESKELYLYKCKSFPDKWERLPSLACGIFIDNVFYKQNGQCYIFTFNQDDELKIYRKNGSSIESFGGEITVSDSGAVRPAGKIINLKPYGEVFIAQIGYPEYGSGLVFKKFTLTGNFYSEEELFRKYASDFKTDKHRNYTGIHTFNVSEHYTVIDVIWKEFRLSEFFYKVVKKIKRILKFQRGMD